MFYFQFQRKFLSRDLEQKDCLTQLVFKKSFK
jgi:hypothetical protein